MLTIVSAAILDFNGVPVALPPPNRHHNVIAYLAGRGDPIPIRGEQGFMTNDGRFVRRKAALRIARKANQIKEKHGPRDMLFSEDCW